ncbi:uncharacterized protein EI97DRAFT_484733 [Westerdykella ornata]|uniref:Uncharacterized protein n=1 Tax=Westerdykella ornata TaxID=318751 RepID=A0A6A6JQR5_WESOR|nr:uncharacterized protein EI97DRAFT_484733 [Westerdykella ornata]KAF2278971.1 hypothetical protein EI97DRAFT_484733 [Westerdykella ornata]
MLSPCSSCSSPITPIDDEIGSPTLSVGLLRTTKDVTPAGMIASASTQLPKTVVEADIPLMAPVPRYSAAKIFHSSDTDELGTEADNWNDSKTLYSREELAGGEGNVTESEDESSDLNNRKEPGLAPVCSQCCGPLGDKLCATRCECTAFRFYCSSCPPRHLVLCALPLNKRRKGESKFYSVATCSVFTTWFNLSRTNVIDYR